MFLTPNKQKAQRFDEIIASIDQKNATSGVYVNGINAMRQSTVWACVRMISEIIAQLPIEIHTKKGNSWKKSNDHEIYEVLAEPNDFQNQHDIISFLQFWSELRGNGFLYKVNAGRQFLYPIPATDADMHVDPKFKITYLIGGEHIQGEFSPDKIFHLRNFGSDGLQGLSTIGNHSRAIGLALQLEEHADSAYKKGLHSNKWISVPELPANKEKRDQFEKRLSQYKGSQNSGEIPIAVNGMEFHEFNAMSAVDAQYIESRQMQKQEIASIFGVPLFLLNDTEKSTTWGTGLEQISRSFIRFSLNPRLNRLSQTLNRELIPSRRRDKTKFVFDTDQFTLGEFKERMEGYAKGIESGTLNANECREIEGREPREGGDDYRIPLNTAIEGEQNVDQDTDQTA